MHRDGVMRLATARDELVPLRDDRVRENPAYLTVVLLGRVVTRLGTIDDVHAGIIENLFASDLAFLQDLYRRVNQEGHTRAGGDLPECEHDVRRRPRRWPPGGIVTYAPDRLHEEVAYVAYHFHWSLDDILDLEHPERRGTSARSHDQHAQPGAVNGHVAVALATTRSPSTRPGRLHSSPGCRPSAAYRHGGRCPRSSAPHTSRTSACHLDTFPVHALHPPGPAVPRAARPLRRPGRPGR